MHIEITYLDGETETVHVELRGGRVLKGAEWIPGHIVGQPDRCYFKADFFEGLIDEGNVREGSADIEIDEDDVDPGMSREDLLHAIDHDGCEAFTWKLVGTDEDECRDMIRKWLGLIGQHFVDREGSTPDRVIPSMSKEYAEDAQCWRHFLGPNHQAVIDEIAAEAGLRPVTAPKP